ncbi:DUF72 domain-containing protein [Duganella sp. Root1480D1]|uniref:DUF72 domain-containing protein n=1 Tax=Duganella sp. Root1480D1 TaxID=1736471 RepID=UPI00070FBC4C|nr:DUF72 domain-containing protein [Duganella sp. Root1480D1]KQZ43314.1 hypothetical protein ASD58_21785 [Duganella sp. Root1480D1]
MNIRVGIGGWDFAPWRDTFYPPEVPLKRALEYASSVLTSIEINGTFYRNAKPEHFAGWAERTPDNFVFAVKASRYATNRKVLGEAGESIERFMDSGLTELGDKLGPILWQLAATKRFDPDDLEAFFKLLPKKLGKRKLRHVLDARHDSFMCPEYLKLAHKYKVATVITDSPKYPNFTEVTGDFVYARLMDAQSAVATGYTKPALKKWASQAKDWSAGGKRDVFVYFINGAKERAPAAAMQLIANLR